jgi:hypothetical protein
MNRKFLLIFFILFIAYDLTQAQISKDTSCHCIWSPLKLDNKIQSFSMKILTIHDLGRPCGHMGMLIYKYFDGIITHDQYQDTVRVIVFCDNVAIFKQGDKIHIKPLEDSMIQEISALSPIAMVPRNDIFFGIHSRKFLFGELDYFGMEKAGEIKLAPYLGKE